MSSSSAVQSALTASAFSNSYVQPALTSDAPYSGVSPCAGGVFRGPDNADQLVVNIESRRDISRGFATAKLSRSKCEIVYLSDSLDVLSKAPLPRAKDARPLLRKWRVKQTRLGRVMLPQ